MPMSPRLLRPLASRSLVDADAAAYLTAVQTADNQALEPAVRNAITSFVIGCKADGIWSAIKASCILMGARTLSGALTPLVGEAPMNSGPFVSGDYNRTTGLKGNGTSKFLDSNRNNNADGQNDNHNAVYVSQMQTEGTLGPYIGAGGFGGGANGIVRSGATSLITLRNRSPGAPVSTLVSLTNTSSHVGFVGMSRSSSATVSARASGSAFSESLTSTTASNDNVLIYRRATTEEVYTDGRLAFYSIGESLDLALLDSRVTTLYNAIGAAI